MTLPYIGSSLDESLEAKARRHTFERLACPRCGLSPFPRGWITNLGICWTCLRTSDGRAVDESLEPDDFEDA